ncbi:Sporozoite surface protein 2 [Senna tora]|uniref:Sporozoite surface protein 2 n=1 Tax=Senna tora TaxID=362788 RepID=A0A834VYK7_9FABA|nr:Sporozoite surface protein 2 [Senna tora]
MENHAVLSREHTSAISSKLKLPLFMVALSLILVRSSKLKDGDVKISEGNHVSVSDQFDKLSQEELTLKKASCTVSSSCAVTCNYNKMSRSNLDFSLSRCSSMEFFSIEVYYGGKLVGEPTFAYEGGHTGWLENCDINGSSYWEANGLEPIENYNDAMAMADIATKSRKVELYIDATSCDEDDVQYESDDSALNFRFNDSEEEEGLFSHGLFNVDVTKSQAIDVPDVATVDVPNAAVSDAAPAEGKTTKKKNRNIRKRKGDRKKKRDKKKTVQVNLPCSQKEDKGTALRGLSDDEYERESLKSIDSDEEGDGLPNNLFYPSHKLLRDMIHASRNLYFDKSDRKRVRVKCPKLTIMDIRDKTQEKWTVNCSMSKARSARKGAHEEINGSFREQFRRLYDYCEEIKRSNPGSNVKLKVQRLPTAEDGTLGPPQFERLYICLDALRRVAYYGLLSALEELLPRVNHRFCVRHMYNYSRKKFPSIHLKNLMWKAAKATFPQEWERAMLEIQKVNESAYQHLKQIPPRFWTKLAFRPGLKSDQLLNNMCETFNAIILKAREKPIVTMLDDIKVYLMVKP